MLSQLNVHFYALLFALLAMLPLGCGGKSSASATVDTGKLQAVCTTGMVADVVRNVGGEHVEIQQLMGAGVDPHLYKTSPRDVSRLNAADVIFYSGWHLEGKMAEVFERLSRSKPAFAIAEKIDPVRLLSTSDQAHDPHLWFDVALWAATIDRTEAALVELDPAHAAEFRRNAAAYRERLLALDREVREALAAVPKEQRVMVTAHDAFRYFGRAYDVEVRGLQGISTESEPGVRSVNELVAFLVERKIKAVFIESSVSDENIRSLLEGCAASGHQVVIGGELYSDAMGEAGTPEGTYEGMVRHNVATIVKALQ